MHGTTVKKKNLSKMI